MPVHLLHLMQQQQASAGSELKIKIGKVPGG